MMHDDNHNVAPPSILCHLKIQVIAIIHYNLQNDHRSAYKSHYVYHILHCIMYIMHHLHASVDVPDVSCARETQTVTACR